MRRKGSGKRRAEQLHARERAWERYGINVGRATRTLIVRRIRDGNSTFVRRTSLRVSVHDVAFEDRILRVVYDRKRCEVVTFLPPPDA